MKRYSRAVIWGLFIMAAVSSCIKKDNFDGPNASLEGTVMDETNKIAVQTCTGNFSIRLEQIDWSDVPTPQNIPIKIDGTYKNSKLFAGHYRISLFGGAFWPTAPQELDIRQGTRLDFQVTPYLYINDFTAELIDSTTLKLKFSLAAPIEGIPNIIDIQPYVNTTTIVGPGASISQYSESRRLTPKSPATVWEWSTMTPAEKSPEIIIPNMLRGRTFYVRVGARLDDTQKNSNLSPVIEIKVP